MNNNLVRNLGIGALAIVAAVALACASGNSNDSLGIFPGDAGSIADDGAERDLTLTPDKAIAPEAAEATHNSAAGSGSSAAPGGAPPVLQTAADRKIVQTGSLQLQVEEVGVGFEEVGRIATGAGGFVASSSFTNRGEAQIASVTIRVPSETYQSVLQQLRGLAKVVDAEESTARDVTEEYTDLESRLRNLEATDAQLLTLLARATTITDILTVQDRLNQVRGEIEQVKGRLQLLDNLTDLATLTVHLRPVAAGSGGGGGSGVNLGETISQAWDDSLAFLGSIAEGVLTVVVFGWWVPVIGVPALLLGRAVTRGRPRPASAVD